MVDDEGESYDSINQIDEEGSLEKAKAQESFNGPDAREEHFKQNIMMNVNEFTADVVAGFQTEVCQDAKDYEKIADKITVDDATNACVIDAY